MNCRTNAMHMKREAIASKGIWKAKKMYILNILIGEDGVLLDTPDLKIMGIETAKSSTPKIAPPATAASADDPNTATMRPISVCILIMVGILA